MNLKPPYLKVIAVVLFVNGLFDRLLRVYLLKRAKIAIQGGTRTSNLDRSYPNLSPLPHQSSKILKNLST